jgi:hypothetical protein
MIRGMSLLVEDKEPMTEFLKVFTSYNIRAFSVEALFILDVAMIIFIGRYLWKYDGSWETFQKRPGVRLAMSFGVYFIGAATIRAWATYMYWLNQRGYDPSASDDTYQMGAVGIVIATVGAAFAIRVLTQSNLTWVITVIVALSFATYVQTGAVL